MSWRNALTQQTYWRYCRHAVDSRLWDYAIASSTWDWQSTQLTPLSCTLQTLNIPIELLFGIAVKYWQLQWSVLCTLLMTIQVSRVWYASVLSYMLYILWYASSKPFIVTEVMLSSTDKCLERWKCSKVYPFQLLRWYQALRYSLNCVLWPLWLQIRQETRHHHPNAWFLSPD